MTNRTRNFGIGSRDMKKAANFALKETNLSFGSTATITERWKKFASFMNKRGLQTMEQVDQKLVIKYGKYLAELVNIGECSPAYAQNLVSAVNTVMTMVTLGKWNSVSPTKDCDIPERSYARTIPPTGINRNKFYSAIDELSGQSLDHGKAIAVLARELGLRTKESALINCHKALHEALAHGVINITEGTKGGRPRTIPITSESQISALKIASSTQASKRSLIPTEMTWAQFREGEIRQTREALQHHGISRLHDLRSAYACERYEAITGQQAPVLGGSVDRQTDQLARNQIALELGHGRIDVTNAYLGSRQ